MSAITITITDTRALTVEGRLVAGETANVTIAGAVPSGLYLVAPDQTVVAACEDWTASETGGTGFLRLATEQVAALFAQTPIPRSMLRDITFTQPVPFISAHSAQTTS